ncbi:MAG: hypothetical protein KDA28_00915, partial [Phycisphaerales bacterium]|nr:hypothetical protein [Phycisphaerales bacterium]
IDLDPTPTVGAVFPTTTNVDRVIRITPDGTEAVCAYLNDVYFVDLTTGAETGRVATGSVGDLVFTSDGTTLCVPNFNFRVIDLASHALVRTITVAACADGAASPVDGRVAALNNRFREDVQVYMINGAASSFEGLALTGPAEEGDAPRDLAVRLGTLIACHNTSRNASIIRNGMVDAYVEVGERPLGAAITPDGRWGVICGTDSDRVTIVDLDTDTIVRTLNVPTRPTHVRISPDGSMAYVLTIAGADRIAFIELDGANSALVGSVPSGQTGSWQGVPFSAFSGIELTHDGSILAVCASFDDVVRLVDTATMSILADIPVGDFPFRIAFTDDDAKAYVSNAFGNSVSSIDMGTRTVVATIPTNQYPNEVAVAGAHAYVGTQQSNGKRVHVIETATDTLVRSVNVEPHAHTAILPEVDEVVFAGTGSLTVPPQLLVIDPTGVIETFDLSGQPSDVVSDDRTFAAYPAVDMIEYETGPSCDWNGDTEVNIFDVIAFLADFQAGDAAADFNGDTVLDIFDVLKLLECL